MPAWLAWLGLQTQWRLDPMGNRAGLDYAACTAWLQAQGWGTGKRRSLRRVLALLGAMESTALEVWAHQREREHRRRSRGKAGR